MSLGILDLLSIEITQKCMSVKCLWSFCQISACVGDWSFKFLVREIQSINKLSSNFNQVIVIFSW